MIARSDVTILSPEVFDSLIASLETLDDSPELAAMAEESVTTIRRRIRDGTIPGYRFGPHQIRIKLEDLEATARRIVSERW